jgi:hypothetical protein
MENIPEAEKTILLEDTAMPPVDLINNFDTRYPYRPSQNGV